MFLCISYLSSIKGESQLVCGATVMLELSSRMPSALMPSPQSPLLQCAVVLMLLLTFQLSASVAPSSPAPSDSLSPSASSTPCGVCFNEGDCYDFTPLTSTDLLLQQIYFFSVRLCGFVSPKNCAHVMNSTSVCMSSVTPPLASYPLAFYSPPSSNWSRLPADRGVGVQLAMTGGIPCADGRPRPVNVQLVCSWRAGLAGFYGDGCTYNFTVLTPLACLSSSSTGGRGLSSSITSTVLSSSTTSSAHLSSTASTALPSSSTATAQPSSTAGIPPSSSTGSTVLSSSTGAILPSSSTGEGNCGPFVDRLEKEVRSLQLMIMALIILVLVLTAALATVLFVRKAAGTSMPPPRPLLSVPAPYWRQSAYQQLQA